MVMVLRVFLRGGPVVSALGGTGGGGTVVAGGGPCGGEGCAAADVSTCFATGAPHLVQNDFPSSSSAPHCLQNIAFSFATVALDG
jgi:hypothetical protein